MTAFFDKDAIKAQWLKLIDHFGNDRINREIWKQGTIAKARKQLDIEMAHELTLHEPRTSQ